MTLSSQRLFLLPRPAWQEKLRINDQELTPPPLWAGKRVRALPTSGRCAILPGEEAIAPDMGGSESLPARSSIIETEDRLWPEELIRSSDAEVHDLARTELKIVATRRPLIIIAALPRHKADASGYLNLNFQLSRFTGFDAL